MEAFDNRLADFVELPLKHGPTKARVLRQTYIVSREVFNPKYYRTSKFMAENIRMKPDDEILDLALYDPGKSLIKRFLEVARHYLKLKGYVQMLCTTIAEPEHVLAVAAVLGWNSAILAKKRGLFETFVIWKLTRENSQELRCA